VTCDDLDTKPWLGSDRDSVFRGLQAAYTTASHLRSAGLEFVVAPIATITGGVAERIDERHSLSVFEHIEGQPGQWGESLETVGRADVVTMLAATAPDACRRSHHRRAPVRRARPRRPRGGPGRRAPTVERWPVVRGGPPASSSRTLTRSPSLFEEVDRFAAATTSGDHLVVTHGEPHPGNLIRTADGFGHGRLGHGRPCHA
jgi:spectinomycin phosphotransferase